VKVKKIVMLTTLLVNDHGLKGIKRRNLQRRWSQKRKEKGLCQFQVCAEQKGAQMFSTKLGGRHSSLL
jgi:hypothetical protein